MRKRRDSEEKRLGRGTARNATASRSRIRCVLRVTHEFVESYRRWNMFQPFHCVKFKYTPIQLKFSQLKRFLIVCNAGKLSLSRCGLFAIWIFNGILRIDSKRKRFHPAKCHPFPVSSHRMSRCIPLAFLPCAGQCMTSMCTNNLCIENDYNVRRTCVCVKRWSDGEPIIVDRR